MKFASTTISSSTKALILLSASILTACGGGGGDATTAGNGIQTTANTSDSTIHTTVKLQQLFDQGGAKVLPTYISHLIGTEKYPLAAVQIENTGSQATLQVSADLPGYGSKNTRTVTISPGEKKTVEISPIIDYARLFQNTTNLPATLTISINSGSTSIFQESHQIQITGRNTVFWSNNGAATDPLIATMVTPQDKNQSIQGLLRGAANRFPGGSSSGMVGYQMRDWPSVSYTIQPGNSQQEYFYVLAGESPNVKIDSVTALLSPNSDISVYIMDDANFAKWSTGETANVCAKNEYATAGSTLTCAPTSTSGYYHIVYLNKADRYVSRTVTRTRAMTKWEVTYHQSKAIFEEIRSRGLTYVNLTGTGFFSSSQNVRYPSESLTGQGANCIDGSLLFASALEALGMEPVIAMSFTAGHAFIAARCWTGSTDCVVPIETTMIGGTSSFDTATSEAGEKWNSWLSGGHLKTLDIKAARTAGVTPAPM